MARNQVDIVLRAIDQASGVFDRINREVDKLQRNPSWQKISRDSALIAGGLIAAGTAAAGFGLAAVGMAGRLEQADIAFTTMLGSAEKADTFLRDLADFAASTPFRFEGLQQSSRLLLAFGFNAEQVLPIVSTLGDANAALGGGEEQLQGIVRAIGQIQTKGKVSAEEMLQLAERGIPAFQILEEKLNLTSEELGNIGAIGIDSATGINALLEGLSERFAGSMEKQSQSLLGLFSTVQDQISLTMTAIGGDIIEALDLKGALKIVIDQIEAVRNRVEDVGLAGIFADIRDDALLAGGAIMGTLVPAIINATIAAARFFARMAPWAIAGALVVTVLDELGVNFAAIADPAGPVARAVMVLRGFTNIVHGIGISIAGIIQANINAVTAALGFYERVFSKLRELDQMVARNPLKIGEAFSELGSTIRQESARATANLDSMLEGDRFRRAQDYIFDGWTQVSNALFGEIDSTAEDSATRIVDKVTEVTEAFGNGVLPGTDALTEGLLGVGDAAEDGVDKAVDEIDRLAKRIAEFNRSEQLRVMQLQAQQGGPSDVRPVPTPEVSGRATGLRAMPRPDVTAEVHLEKALGFFARAVVNAARTPRPMEPGAPSAGGLPTADPGLLTEADDAATQLNETLPVTAGLLFDFGAALDPLDEQMQAVNTAVRRQIEAEMLRGEQVERLTQLQLEWAQEAARADPRNIERLAQQQGAYADATQDVADVYADTQRVVDDLIATFKREAEVRERLKRLAEPDNANRLRAQQGGDGTNPPPSPPSDDDTEGAKELDEAAKSAAFTLQDLASTHLPLFGDALQGLATGGPIGAVLAVFGQIASESKAFEGILEAITSTLGVLAQAVGTVLDAIWPIVEPILQLTEVLAPLIQILAKVVTPIFQALGTALGWLADIVLAVVNGIIDVYNFLLGWLLGRVDRIKREERKATGSTDDAERRAGGNRIAEITGATRDLLVDLLTPLAHLPSQLVIMEQIRDILDERLIPGATGQSVTPSSAGVGIGAITINVNGTDDPRATADAVYSLLTRRLDREMRLSAR